LGKHPARAMKGDVVGIVCTVEDPLDKAFDFRQFKLDFVVHSGDLFWHLFFLSFSVSH
jgi:hypothetical protein